MKMRSILTTIKDGEQLSINHSADYTYIESSLKSRWKHLSELANDFKEFVPRPTSDFAAERQERFLTYRNFLNPTASDARLNEIVSRDIELLSRPDFQYIKAFDERIAQEYVISCFLSQALCEAIVNYIFAIELTSRENTSDFSKEERQSFLDKWTKGLSKFFPQYSLQEGDSLYESLIKLISQRKALMHNKISLIASNGEELTHPTFEREAFKDEISWIARFQNLPFDLMERLCKASGNPTYSFLLKDRAPIKIGKLF